MTEEKKYLGIHQVEVVQEIGNNVRIKRTDGGLFTTCSFLRHHGGKRIETKELLVSGDMLKSNQLEIMED